MIATSLRQGTNDCPSGVAPLSRRETSPSDGIYSEMPSLTSTGRVLNSISASGSPSAFATRRTFPGFVSDLSITLFTPHSTGSVSQSTWLSVARVFLSYFWLLPSEDIDVEVRAAWLVVKPYGLFLAIPPRHSAGPLRENFTRRLSRGHLLPSASTTSNCTRATSLPSAFHPVGFSMAVSLRATGAPAVYFTSRDTSLPSLS